MFWAGLKAGTPSAGKPAPGLSRMENWTGGDDTGLLRVRAPQPFQNIHNPLIFLRKMAPYSCSGRVSRPEPPLQASLRRGFPGWKTGPAGTILGCCARAPPQPFQNIHNPLIFLRKMAPYSCSGRVSRPEPPLQASLRRGFPGWKTGPAGTILGCCARALHSPSRTFIIRSFFSEKWLLIHVLGGSQGRNPLCRQACAGAFRP